MGRLERDLEQYESDIETGQLVRNHYLNNSSTLKDKSFKKVMETQSKLDNLNQIHNETLEDINILKLENQELNFKYEDICAKLKIESKKEEAFKIQKDI